MSKSKSANYNPKSSNKVYSAVITEILDNLERGNLVWRKPWNYTQYSQGLFNPISEKPFTGRNVFLLAWFMMIRGYSSPLFASEKQVIEAGGEIIDGETGIPVVRYSERRESKSDAAERLEIDVKDVKWTDRNIKFLKPVYYRVFNIAAQTTGIEIDNPNFEPVLTDFAPIERCENLVAGYSDAPKIIVGDDGRAVYRGGSVDTVSMPPNVAFDSEQEYYSTLFHELAHSTGHRSRLDRDMTGTFGTKSYAIEELVAEITAAMLCGETGIVNHTVENSSAYIADWLTVLKSDPDIIFKAIDNAIVAADYVQKTGKFAPMQPVKA